MTACKQRCLRGASGLDPRLLLISSIPRTGSFCQVKNKLRLPNVWTHLTWFNAPFDIPIRVKYTTRSEHLWGQTTFITVSYFCTLFMVLYLLYALWCTFFCLKALFYSSSHIYEHPKRLSNILYYVPCCSGTFIWTLKSVLQFRHVFEYNCTNIETSNLKCHLLELLYFYSSRVFTCTITEYELQNWKIDYKVVNRTYFETLFAEIAASYKKLMVTKYHQNILFYRLTFSTAGTGCAMHVNLKSASSTRSSLLRFVCLFVCLVDRKRSRYSGT